MPGFTTHYIIGVQAFHALPEGRLKQILSTDPSIYQLGAQGPDIFFYNFLLLRHRREYNTGIIMHEFHIREFFASLFDALAETADDAQFCMAAAYIAGYMAHYVADSIVHPYVYGRIGHSPKEHRRCVKSRVTSLHCRLENDIDAIMLMQYLKQKPSEFDQAATFSMDKTERRFVSRFLCDAINETYYPLRYGNTFAISTGVVQRSIWLMKLGCRVLSDPHASKRRKVQTLERLFRRSAVASSKLVTDDISDVRWALNTMHEPWVNPWDKSMVSQDSFQDLYEKTLHKLAECYALYDRFLTAHASDPALRSALLEALGNQSLHSGLCAG